MSEDSQLDAARAPSNGLLDSDPGKARIPSPSEVLLGIGSAFLTGCSMSISVDQNIAWILVHQIALSTVIAGKAVSYLTIRKICMNGSLS